MGLLRIDSSLLTIGSSFVYAKAPDGGPMGSIGYWDFENNLLDKSPNGNDLSGGVTYNSDGLIGACALKSGSGGLQQNSTAISSLMGGSSSWTMSIWINFFIPSGARSLFTCREVGGEGSQFQVKGTFLGLTLYSSNMSGLGSNNIGIGGSPIGQWTHKVWGYDKDTVSTFAYSNSVFVADTSLDYIGTWTDAGFDIGGSRSDPGDEFIYAYIDQARLYDRRLSQEEIDLLWNGGAGR